MNIIEALKSGKNFKRKDWSTYLCYHDDHRFNSADILADDWEIEVAREITTLQFWSAVTQAQKSGDIETLPFRLAEILKLE